MDVVTFLVIYVVLLFAMIICEIWILSNDKSRYLKISYRSLKSICETFYDKDKALDSKFFSLEINRFYNEFLQEMPQLKKHYPNVVVWLDAIIFWIDCNKKTLPFSSNIHIV